MVLLSVIHSFLTLQKEYFSWKVPATTIFCKEKLLVLSPDVNKMSKVNNEVTKPVSENCL